MLPRVVGEIMLTDPIADLLTRIRNGYKAGKFEVKVPFSKPKQAVLEVLKKHKFIESFRVEEEKAPKKTLRVLLKYKPNHKAAIEVIRRVSKPGLRIYKKAKDLPRVLGGYGIAVISTSAGVMTAEEARKKNLGGEAIAEVW